MHLSRTRIPAPDTPLRNITIAAVRGPSQALHSRRGKQKMTRMCPGPDKTRSAPGRRLAVMVSGSGRTLLNLLERTRDGRLHAEVVLVIASRECPGAEHGRAATVPTVVRPGVIPAHELDTLLRAHDADWLVLAGYLHKVDIPGRMRGRAVNIHPALLPGHGGPGMYGKRVHRAVLEAGDTLSGCTVHLCDEEYDRGPIVLQRACPVEPEDTPETLAARVFELEREAYPEALELLMSGRVTSAGTDA